MSEETLTTAEVEQTDQEFLVEIVATRKIGNVMLVGQVYRCMPPKTLVAVEFGKKMKEIGNDTESLLRELQEWLSVMFGRKVAPEIIARLRDPKDDLDLPHILELIKKITEKATGNPTT